MIHVGDIMFSTAGRHHDTCVGNVQCLHIFCDNPPPGIENPPWYSRYISIVLKTSSHGTEYPPRY